MDVQERVVVLQSEVTRLKTRLAARAGDEDLMTFLFKGGAGDTIYLDDLRNRLACVHPSLCCILYLTTRVTIGSAAEDKVAALQQALSDIQENNPDAAAQVKVEADLREELTQVRRQLEKFQAIYGDASSALSPDLQHLSQQLQEKEAELQKLRLQERQRDQVRSRYAS